MTYIDQISQSRVAPDTNLAGYPAGLISGTTLMQRGKAKRSVFNCSQRITMAIIITNLKSVDMSRAVIIERVEGEKGTLLLTSSSPTSVTY